MEWANREYQVLNETDPSQEAGLAAASLPNETKDADPALPPSANVQEGSSALRDQAAFDTSTLEEGGSQDAGERSHLAQRSPAVDHMQRHTTKATASQLFA